MSRESQVYTVARACDLPVGSHQVVQVGQRKIGLFNIGGTYFALPNLCPHQLGPLCEGRVSGTLITGPDYDWKLAWGQDGEIVTCPWHGMEYHVPTGQCLAYPEIRLRTYEVWVEGEMVKIRV